MKIHYSLKLIAAGIITAMLVIGEGGMAFAQMPVGTAVTTYKSHVTDNKNMTKTQTKTKVKTKTETKTDVEITRTKEKVKKTKVKKTKQIK